MSNPESIIQIEDAAMKDLFDLSAMSPRTVFQGDDFEKHTSRYLDLLVTSVAGVARLHPDAVTCSLHAVGGDELAAYNHETSMSAHQAWYEPIDQSHMYKQLSLKAPMDSYVLGVEAVQGIRNDHAFKSINIFQRSGSIMEGVGLVKPFICGKDLKGVLQIDEGGYFARVRGERGYMPFNVFTIDALRPCNSPHESTLQELTFPEDKQVYEQNGNEGLYASVLWRMGWELCFAAGITPPDAN